MTMKNNLKKTRTKSDMTPWLNNFFKLTHEKTKKSIFSPGINIFPNFFFLKYFLVDKLTIANKFFRLAIFYRKIGRKMTFDFEGPWNPVDMTFHKISNCFIIPRA